ncbi:GNAT family N-acetyltransferase [Veronia pacifica]|uniref:N-acetyltransferase domain-containing protein n=1 Tax=Veronia pacifica TaxID=1080227 RepID=A0A1C3ES72_9GAMM|nr:GNAT family N-acetyltransferase [Veronia pacifica]ODA36071.1 hypothetical protein A8L45_00240 [Veronia pacifica]
MSHDNYQISILKRKSQLDNVLRLTHDSLVEIGAINPAPSGMFNFAPHLDETEDTTVLIAEKDGEIIGTSSITIDGKAGLISDHLFERETNRMREKSSSPISSAWRFATKKEYRNNKKLAVDLMTKTREVLRESNSELCLCLFQEKHVRFYQKFFNGEVVAKKIGTADGSDYANFVLMAIAINDVRSKV